MDKGLHTFPIGISPKVNVVAGLEFELAYYDVTVQHFSHYHTVTPPIFSAVFKGFFCTRLFGIKYFYLIEIILIHVFDLYVVP